MKMQDIRRMAKRLGVNSFGLSKADLIRAVQRAEGNYDCFGTALEDCDQAGCAFREDCLPPVKPARK